jgi:predicted dehydrogenase
VYTRVYTTVHYLYLTHTARDNSKKRPAAPAAGDAVPGTSVTARQNNRKMTLHDPLIRPIVDNRPTDRLKAAKAAKAAHTGHRGCRPTSDQEAMRVPPSPHPIRWGIVGTANIARAQFLPGLREAGGGRATSVASRDQAKAEAYAIAHGIDQGIEGYQALVESPDIDAVYVALPNALHAEPTIQALRAGKAVLCEKPLSVGAAQTKAVLDVAATAARPLWEAFVFPFQTQHRRLVRLLEDGAIGEPAELYSAFHFPLSNPANIRMDAALGGGALADVGCYPIRLAFELFGAGAGASAAAGAGTESGGEAQARACEARTENGVDTDAAGIVTVGARRLLLTCGFKRSFDTFTSVLGSAGQIRLTNPFHPGPADTLTISRPNADPVTERPTTDQRSFTAAIRHIHAVLRGEEAAVHTAADYSLPAARVLEELQQLIAI